MDKLKKILALCVLLLILPSCAVKPPLVLQLPESKRSIPLSAKDLKSAIGEMVRWGGIISETKNTNNKAQLIILGYPLDGRASPDIYGQSNTRRFIANFNHVLDPTVFSNRTKITVIGKFDRIEENKIGEFTYQFPVVSVDKYALWKEQRYYSYEPNYSYDNYRWYGYSPYIYPFYWDYDRHHRHHNYW